MFLQSFSRYTIGSGFPPYYGHGAPSTGQPAIAAAFAYGCEPGRVGHLLVAVRAIHAPHFRGCPWREGRVFVKDKEFMQFMEEEHMA